MSPGEHKAQEIAERIAKFARAEGRSPSPNAKNEDERNLAMVLYKFRRARKGVGVWYPSVDRIAEKYGVPLLFL